MADPSRNQKVLLIGLGLVLPVVLLEGGLRVGAFIHEIRRQRANREFLAQGADVRILCLGESTTYFGGTDSYPAQLGRILNAVADGISFSVVNRGVPATDTDHILADLEKNLDRFHPQVLVTMMGINDRRFLEARRGGFLEQVSRWLETLRVYRLYALLVEHLGHRIEELRGVKRRMDEPAPSVQQASLGGIPMTPIVRRAMRLFQEGNIMGARSLLVRYLEQEPEDALAQGILADLDSRLGLRGRRERMEVTARGLEKRLKQQPRDLEARSALARIHVDGDDPSSALAVLSAFTTEDLADQGRRLLLAKAERLAAKHAARAEDWSRAAQHLEKALAVQPTDQVATLAELHTRLGRAYDKIGRSEEARQHFREGDRLLHSLDVGPTRRNYLALKRILDHRGIPLVAVQYPMRKLAELRAMLLDAGDVVFVDNEESFSEVLERERYSYLFKDEFAGDFGHMTVEGYRLLATNVARQILTELFDQEWRDPGPEIHALDGPPEEDRAPPEASADQVLGAPRSVE